MILSLTILIPVICHREPSHLIEFIQTSNQTMPIKIIMIFILMSIESTAEEICHPIKFLIKPNLCLTMRSIQILEFHLPIITSIIIKYHSYKVKINTIAIRIRLWQMDKIGKILKVPNRLKCKLIISVIRL